MLFVDYKPPKSKLFRWYCFFIGC